MWNAQSTSLDLDRFSTSLRGFENYVVTGLAGLIRGLISTLGRL